MEIKHAYLMEKSDLAEFADLEQGLSSAVVARKQEYYGANELAKEKGKGLISRLMDQLADPMVVILLVAAVISALLGEWADSVIIAAVVSLNAFLGLYQEGKAARAAEALAAMNSPLARVKRNGALLQIKSSELVPGDLVYLENGDSVPADMRLLEAANLRVDESSLTGESLPVDKNSSALNTGKENPPLSQLTNMVFMGSPVVYGRGMGMVTATGADSKMGNIAGLLATATAGKTPLQKRLAHLSKILSLAVIIICLVIFVISVSGAFGDFSRLLSAFMLAVSLAVAAIPEGMVVVVTLVLSMGMKQMSKAKAIIRRLSAVETLGSVQVICSDKTGTLTQNKMTVRASLGDKALLARAVCLCNDCSYQAGEIKGEPTEMALMRFACDNHLLPEQLKESYPRIAEIPFDSNRKLMTTYHNHKTRCVCYSKGAPEQVLNCCDRYLDEDGQTRSLSPKIKAAILAQNEALADQALRVLAAAYAEENSAARALARGEKGLIFIGLLGMTDPPRPEVKTAVAEAQTAGIKIIMVTGDQPKTAIAIARELGIFQDGDEVVEGTELSAISDRDLRRRLPKIKVFARVLPEDKLRIVRAWQQRRQVTAMTGDGVNDAPALKAADIGVGMGLCGSEVSRQAANLVLADDNFATIISAVREGRRIYENIRRALQFLLSSNLAEVLAIFFASLMGVKLFLPIHLLWINLITDCFPAIALGMEKGDDKAMQRPPIKAQQGIFSQGLGVDVIWQGLAAAVLTLISFAVAAPLGRAAAMSMAFLTLTCAELSQALNMRSCRGSLLSVKTRNPHLALAILGGLAINLLIVYIPTLSGLFQLTALPLPTLAVSLLLGFAMIPLIELGKGLCRLFSRKIAN